MSNIVMPKTFCSCAFAKMRPTIIDKPSWNSKVGANVLIEEHDDCFVIIFFSGNNLHML